MTLWYLEFLRMWRTQRWLILVSVYGVFGILGPLTVRYLPDLMDALGEEAVGTLPAMTPPDGIAQYIGNATQIGILAVAFVGAAALAFDSNLEMSVFLRTRATVRDIFTPRYVVVTITAIVSFLFGLTLAYIGTGILLEWLDAGAVVLGGVLHSIYLAFAVAVIGFVSSFIKRVPGVALLSVGILIVIGLLSLVGPIARWLPNELIGAIDTLVRGGEFREWGAVVVTLVVTVALLVFAVRRLEHREM